MTFGDLVKNANKVEVIEEVLDYFELTPREERDIRKDIDELYEVEVEMNSEILIGSKTDFGNYSVVDAFLLHSFPKTKSTFVPWDLDKMSDLEIDEIYDKMISIYPPDEVLISEEDLPRIWGAQVFEDNVQEIGAATFVGRVFALIVYGYGYDLELDVYRLPGNRQEKIESIFRAISFSNAISSICERR